MTTVTKQVRDRVEAKVAACVAAVEKRYNIKVRPFRVNYEQRGTVGGTASYTEWCVRYNPTLLMENVDHFLSTTVPHEVAHLVHYQLYPSDFQSDVRWTGKKWKRTKRDVHGYRWQEVMRAMGVANPSRTHRYDVQNAQVKVKSKYHYVCTPGCRHEDHFVSSVIHNRHQRAKLMGRPGYRCNTCRAELSLVVKLGQVTYKEARTKVAEAAKKPTPKVVDLLTKQEPTGSKFDQCYAEYAKYIRQFGKIEGYRQHLINYFMDTVGMTKSGAQTYFYKCEQKHSG